MLRYDNHKFTNNHKAYLGGTLSAVLNITRIYLKHFTPKHVYTRIQWSCSLNHLWRPDIPDKNLVELG